MKVLLLIVIGALLWNNDDARSFTSEQLYHVADFIQPESQTQRILNKYF